MEHFSLAERLQDTLSGQVPAIIGALLLLIVGYHARKTKALHMAPLLAVTP